MPCALSPYIPTLRITYVRFITWPFNTVPIRKSTPPPPLPPSHFFQRDVSLPKPTHPGSTNQSIHPNPNQGKIKVSHKRRVSSTYASSFRFRLHISKTSPHTHTHHTSHTHHTHITWDTHHIHLSKQGKARQGKAKQFSNSASKQARKQAQSTTNQSFF